MRKNTCPSSPLAGGSRCADTIIVAHRGASRDAPENTIPAFELAWKQGADAIEGDFQLTKDGHIVCIHDNNTGRIAATGMSIRNSTLAALRKIDTGPCRDNSQKIMIPTIAEVFSTIPRHKTIYIEVKCGPEIIPVLLKEINSSGLKEEQVIIISFNEKVIQEFKSKAPQYMAYWLCSFAKRTAGRITPSLATVLKTLEAMHADGLDSNTVIPESYVKAIIAHGYTWHAWTVNDFKEAKRIKALGAKSITTDTPGSLKRKLAGQKMSGRQPGTRPAKE